MDKPQIAAFGQDAILLIWPQDINVDYHRDVLRYEAVLGQEFEADILEMIPAYQSLMLVLHEGVNQEVLMTEIKRLNLSKINSKPLNQTIYHVPVCYDLSLAPDLEKLADAKGYKVKEIIRFHKQVPYQVYFIGFLPGFLYLGGLDDRLHYPRLDEPRLKVPKGAVGIGGNQTGIYPQESPGGWQIIGRTPIDLFHPIQDIPSVFKPLDYVQFYEVNLREYETILALDQAGKFRLRKEVVNG